MLVPSGLITMQARPRRLIRIRLCSAVIAGLGLLCTSAAIVADTLVEVHKRVGGYPDYDGSGWLGEVWLNVPETSSIFLTGAEQYAATRAPDFTFRTAWIDFPAGPAEIDPKSDTTRDVTFATVGDFLNDYIYDVSDPAMLAMPYGNFFIRFTGLLRVKLEDGTQSLFGMPVWVDFASFGFDGFRTRVDATIYRQQIANPNSTTVATENGIFLGLGLFPIEITYFNRYDPAAELGYDRSGLELYSWHGGGMPWPAGNAYVHPVRGPMTLLPPWVIFQPEDIQAIVPGDFEADGDVDLDDAHWYAECVLGPADIHPILNCDTLDASADGFVDLSDLAIIQNNFGG